MNEEQFCFECKRDVRKEKEEVTCCFDDGWYCNSETLRKTFVSFPDPRTARLGWKYATTNQICNRFGDKVDKGKKKWSGTTKTGYKKLFA